MRYLYLDLNEEDKAVKEKRENGKSMDKSQIEAMPPEVLKEFLEAKHAVCGEKELIMILMDHSRIIAIGADLKRFSKIYQKLSDIEDPEWLVLDEDEWKWMKEKIEGGQYGETYKNEQGNSIPYFSAVLKRKIGKLLIKLDETPNSPPKDYLDKKAKISLVAQDTPLDQ